MFYQKWDFYINVAVMGDPGVGKTALIQRLQSPHSPIFEYALENRHDVREGLYLLSSLFEYEDLNLCLRLWDVASYFHIQRKSLVATHARGTRAYLVVFDVTQTNAFSGVEKWVGLARKSSEKPFIILVGNKVDELEKLDNNAMKETLRCGIRDLSTKLGIPFIEVSAKTGVGVRKALHQLLYFEEKNTCLLGTPEVVKPRIWDRRLKVTIAIQFLAGMHFPLPLSKIIAEYFSAFCEESVSEEVFKDRFNRHYKPGRMGGHWAPMFGKNPEFNILSVVNYAAQKPVSETAKALAAMAFDESNPPVAAGPASVAAAAP